MKKITYLLSILLLTLVSCTSGGESGSGSLNDNGTKLKKAIVAYNNGASLITQDYTYFGNKLSRITITSGGEASFSDITYTGNFITKMIRYRNNVLISTTYLEYENEQLVKKKTLVGSDGYKVVYAHNIDGTINVTEYKGDLTNQNTVVRNHKVFFENGLVSKIEKYDGGVTLTKSYTYDDKNDPNYAILGYGKLTFYEIGSIVSPHNVIAITYTASNTSDSDTDVREYVYNSFNFPKKSTDIDPGDDGGSSIVNKYYYE